MPFTLATWNINSVRLREGLVAQLMAEEQPDILCLQECKSPVELIPLEHFRALGYGYMVARGQKGYNGVAILSKLPITDAGGKDFANLGDIPDRTQNEEFGQKLDFLTEMRDAFHGDRPQKSILVGDLNIAPREDDVWNHKQLLKIVSHTPIEVAHLTDTQAAGGFVDVTRADIPAGPLYSWWSYRSPDWDAGDKGRRLDHVWATGDIAGAAHGSRILRAVRGWEQPSDHVPVFATVDL